MTKEIQETTENNTTSVNNIKKEKKKIPEQKKLKSKKSKAKINKKKFNDLTKNELKLQQEMLKIWKSTYVSLREATEKAKEAKVYTSSLKAIVTFVLMKNMFLEVRKEIEKMSNSVEKLSVNFVIKFIKKARNVGECLDSENNSEDEKMGLILVSLRYHLEPVTMASVAWKLAEGDIGRAIHMLCPKLYAMKNRDYEFIGQEAAYLRVFWKSGVKVTDTESEKMEKLLEIANECDDSLIEIWKLLYTTVNQSNNPFGVNQFNNMLGGLSLNGYWKMETLVEFIKREMTLEWLDNRFGDSGRVVSRLWKRLYSSKNNAINREEEKKIEETILTAKAATSTSTSPFSTKRRSNSISNANSAATTTTSTTNTSSSDVNVLSMINKANYYNGFDSKREFVNRLELACSLDGYKKNEISLYLDLPELYGAAAHIVMIDENPVFNQFLRYCGPCKKYPIHYAREALKMNQNHLTKTLDMLAWWREYRNPFIISADKFWELAIETCELDEEILYENYGNIDDFKALMQELIKNESFRSRKEMEIEEKKFQKVFTVMANGGIDEDEEDNYQGMDNGGKGEERAMKYGFSSSTLSSLSLSAATTTPSSDSENNSIHQSTTTTTPMDSNSSSGCSDDDEGNTTTTNKGVSQTMEKKKTSGGIYRPPSKRGLYGLTHASIINKRQSMNFATKKELTSNTTTTTTTTTPVPATTTIEATTTAEATTDNLNNIKSENDTTTTTTISTETKESTPTSLPPPPPIPVMLPPSPPISDFDFKLEGTDQAESEGTTAADILAAN